MSDDEMQLLARSISGPIKAYVERRLDEFRSIFRAPVDGKDGAPGARGADGARGEKGDPGEAGEAGAQGPQGERGERGEKGEPGPAGSDGARGERGEKGLDGADGADGARGADGRDFDPAALDAAVRAEVGKQFGDVYERILRAIPAPKDGASVTLADVTPLLEGEVSKWELEFERRATDLLQRALDRIPKGRDGADGIGVDDFELEAIDGGRTIAISIAASSGLIIRKEITTAIPVDRGPYAIGRAYEPGDGVTYGGSFWIAQQATATSPGDSKSGLPWRLAVKHGRDAK